MTCFLFQIYGTVYFNLVEVTPGVLDYFGINENGQIFLKKSLVGSGTDTYEV